MDLKNFTAKLVEFSVNFKDELNVLDGQIGDGDLGNTIVQGTKALQKITNEVTFDQWLVIAGKEFRKAAPSTMGILLSSALIHAGKSLGKNKELTLYSNSYWLLLQKEMINEIKKRGGAKEGDKTILDSFIPAMKAFEENVDSTLESALEKAMSEAKKGAENTKGMISKTGRSSWLGERANMYVDGGAWLCYLMYEFLYNYLKNVTIKVGCRNE